MKDLPDRISDAICGFDFQAYDGTGDLDPDTVEARESWVYDLGEHIAVSLLPVSIESEEDKIGEIVHKFLLQYGSARSIAARDELVRVLREHLRMVLAEASAAGLIEEV